MSRLPYARVGGVEVTYQARNPNAIPTKWEQRGGCPFADKEVLEVGMSVFYQLPLHRGPFLRLAIISRGAPKDIVKFRG